MSKWKKRDGESLKEKKRLKEEVRAENEIRNLLLFLILKSLMTLDYPNHERFTLQNVYCEYNRHYIHIMKVMCGQLW